MLEQTLANHGIDEAIVVGQSMGALVAVNLAERAPERVKGLVLLAIPPEMRFLHVNLLGHLSFLPVTGPIAWNYGPDFMIRKGLGVLFAPKFEIPDWLLREVRNVRHDDARILRDELEAHLNRVHPRDQIERIGKPTVIVWGEQDQFWPIPAAAEYEGTAPIVRLPGVGHTAQVEAPERVIEEIERLAASIPAAAPTG
jgi:pimeloyl-ACP methyl ester carboxylesterase